MLIKIIALESANDAEGFLFWLARAEGPAQKWTGEKKTKNGVEFVKQGYYITIRYYERFPAILSLHVQAEFSKLDCRC